MSTYLKEGDKVEIQGSGKKPYLVRKIGGVVDCSCPAWRNLGGPIDVRVCKHIKANIDPTCLLPQAQAMFGGVVAPKAVAAPVSPQATSVPVVLTAPAVKYTKTGKISTAVGGVTVKDTAPPCLLAHKWEGEDPTGMWMSEKLDGVRAWWDGDHFVSRLGNTYHAPEWFKAELPDICLDGELFIGRKRFQETVSAVRKLVPTDSEWKNVKFMVFDAPEEDGTFEERMEYLNYEINEHGRQVFTPNGVVLEPPDSVWNSDPDRILFLVEQIKCTGQEHLEAHLRKLEALGAEGVMLREAGSKYEEGRSRTCLKVKTFFDDEAVVTGYTAGRGKHKGRVGALECKWKGVTFEVGTGLTDKERENPPSIGSVITFRYQELSTEQIPRFPSFVSARDYE